MDVLHSLPSEILVEILSSLPAADLASTSCLSHRLHAISQPLLYAAPRLTTCDDVEPDAPLSSLGTFLATLLTACGKPRATLVRSLTLRWTNATAHPIGPRPHPLLDDLALLTPAPSPFALSSQLANTQLLLLLARLPNLQALHVTDINRATETFDDFIVEATTWLTPHPYAFHSLREVRFRSIYRAHGVSQKTLLTLMTLPAIDDIDVSLCTRQHFNLSAYIGCSSTVTKLRLSDTIVCCDELRWILRVPRALTHFSFSLVDRFDFRPALARLRGSLRCLCLQALNSEGLRPEELVDVAVGSLREWTCLRTLRCAMVLLLGYGLQRERLSLVDVLPVGLCELEFFRDDEYSADVVVEVVGLLVRKAELVPALKRLKVAWAVGKEREILRDVCWAVDVEFVENGEREDGSDDWGL